MNILLTSVGRRIYLVDWFRKALGNTGLVHVANSVATPTFLAADKSVVTPLIYDASYIDFLLSYCKENEISAIISLFDVDLPVLSKNRKRFEDAGVEVVISDERVINICNDKWNTYEFLKEHDIACPEAFLSPEAFFSALDKGEVSLPAIIKPRWGMGSIGVYSADTREEVLAFYNSAKDMALNSYLKYESGLDVDHCIIIQEKLDGIEHGLDVVNDLDCGFVTTIVKRKLAMRAGETDSATVIDDTQLFNLGHKLGESLKHRSNLDVDVFMTSKGPAVLEMNARFGGGYPFSHMSGVNLPKQIVEWLAGKPTDMRNFIHQVNVGFQKEITLRPLLDSDRIPEARRVDELGELSNLIKALEGRLSPSLSARNIDIDGYAERLFSNGLAFAAYQGDKPVALIAGYANDMENCSAYISFLAVDSCAEGLNIGSRLFRMFEVECNGHGMNEIVFEVHKVNNKAIAFYYNLGAYIDSEKDEGSWIMKKKLSGGGYGSLSSIASYLCCNEVAA